jgi:predicted Zn-dependent protease
LKRLLMVFCIVALCASGAQAQFGGLDKVVKLGAATKEWSPEEERQIGEAAAAKVIAVFSKEDGGISNNEQHVYYVNLVGQTLAQFATRPLPYRFAILNTDIVWACAMPGGYVFVTRGALDRIDDEAELAGLLAHEIAHVDGRHLEQIIRKKKLTKLAVEEGTSRLPAAALAGIANELITTALNQQYGPDKEKDADKKGMTIASSAGYDPTGLKRFLNLLAEKEKDAAKTNQWGASHPPIPERVKRLDAAMKGLPPTGEVLAERFKTAMAPPPPPPPPAPEPTPEPTPTAEAKPAEPAPAPAKKPAAKKRTTTAKPATTTTKPATTTKPQ